ncbi:hypothetical protein VTI28DRAFT_2538 [Corynascus sepedonium]
MEMTVQYFRAIPGTQGRDRGVQNRVVVPKSSEATLRWLAVVHFFVKIFPCRRLLKTNSPRPQYDRCPSPPGFDCPDHHSAGLINSNMYKSPKSPSCVISLTFHQRRVRERLASPDRQLAGPVAQVHTPLLRTPGRKSGRAGPPAQHQTAGPANRDKTETGLMYLMRRTIAL